MGYEMFQKLCDDRGITPYKVAQDLGFSRGTFTDWKMGRSTPKVPKMSMVSDYFDIPIEYFYADDSTLDFTNIIQEYMEEKGVDGSKPISYEEDMNVYFDAAKKYYTFAQTSEEAQELFKKYGILLDACKDMTPEQINHLASYAKFIKDTENGGENYD